MKKQNKKQNNIHLTEITLKWSQVAFSVSPVLPEICYGHSNKSSFCFVLFIKHIVEFAAKLFLFINEKFKSKNPYHNHFIFFIILLGLQQLCMIF